MPRRAALQSGATTASSSGSAAVGPANNAADRWKSPESPRIGAEKSRNWSEAGPKCSSRVGPLSAAASLQESISGAD